MSPVGLTTSEVSFPSLRTNAGVIEHWYHTTAFAMPLTFAWHETTGGCLGTSWMMICDRPVYLKVANMLRHGKMCCYGPVTVLTWYLFGIRCATFASPQRVIVLERWTACSLLQFRSYRFIIFFKVFGQLRKIGIVFLASVVYYCGATKWTVIISAILSKVTVLGTDWIEYRSQQYMNWVIFNITHMC